MEIHQNNFQEVVRILLIHVPYTLNTGVVAEGIARNVIGLAHVIEKRLCF